MVEELTYKGRNYIYGFEKIRDYPYRGKTSLTFYIKLKYGVKFFEQTKIVLQTTELSYKILAISSVDRLLKRVEKVIDKYIITSRRRKLKILNRKN